MSRFGDGLRIIPRTARVIAAVIYLAMADLAFFVLIPADPEMSRWPVAGRLAFAYGIFLLIVAWILLVGYVHADAKRRGMRYVMWTWLAALVPNGIGIILYFLLRDPLPRPCPGCSTVVRAGYTFCPHCGATMQPTCPQCGKGVEAGWTHCPHCGAGLPSQVRARS
jgi:hypothetical protein